MKRHRLLSALFAGACLLGASPGLAQQGPIGIPPSSGAPQGGPGGGGMPSEMLKFAPPAGWMLLHSLQSPETRRAVFVPEGQNEREWRDMLIVTTTRGENAPGLGAVHKRVVEAYKNTCQAHTAGSLQKKVEGGIGKAFWIQGCHRRRDRDVGEASFNLFLQGKEAVYLIQRIWMLPPFGKEGPPIPTEDRNQTMEMLGQVEICDPTAGDAACSPGAPVQ